jgi:6-pyruvoyltetrahydropterin/6-carboxytetrahydropterin synthase
MYTVCVRDHFMIAHSFRGAAFGPAQQLHGATYIVDVEFRRQQLDQDGVVVDIGLAADVLAGLLAGYNFRNLDEESSFTGQNTTTEFLAYTIFCNMQDKVRDGSLGPEAQKLASMRVTLHESHIAWAAYEGELSPMLEG